MRMTSDWQSLLICRYVVFACWMLDVILCDGLYMMVIISNCYSLICLKVFKSDFVRFFVYCKRMV